MNKLERASALDRVGGRLQPKVWSLLRPQRVKDALRHGTSGWREDHQFYAKEAGI
ncbi:hypothetical protein [Micromonospora sp. NPDC049282]|uniref:hypothetical protein n=1 Tax=Micromonospora sp. NPDC049282 TaxID=3364269 RepID=UPI00371507AA